MSSQFSEAQRRHQRGDVPGAIRIYKTILTRDPKDGRSKLFLGLALQQTGHHAQALESASGALDFIKNPTFADHSTYGIILKNSGKIRESIDQFQVALSLSPDHPAVLSNLATAHLAMGELEIAKEMFASLVSLLPEDPAPNLNLARIFIQNGDLDGAASHIEAAGRQDPAHPDFLYLKAQIYFRDTHYEEASNLLIRLLDKHLGHADGWKLLRMVVGQLFIDADKICKLLDRLADSAIGNARILTPAVGIARHNVSWKNITKLESRLNIQLEDGLDYTLDATSVFDLLGCNVSQLAHLNASRLAWKALTADCSKTERARLFNERLRVGIISSDLREHAIGHLIAGFVQCLSHDKIDWVAYTNSADDGGRNREIFRNSFKNMVSVYRLSDDELADLIIEDGIDVLIDLNGMTSDTRVAVFARRPAPLQIQWLGMPGTLGADEHIDYVIVDKWVVDQNNSNGFSEGLILLPRSYQPNDHVPPDLSLSSSREAEELPKTGVVFGCFNQHYKISPDTFECWMQILQSVPNSVLWLLEPKNKGVKARLQEMATSAGVSGDRLLFAKQRSQANHLARLKWMDLVLDTWPYNAHTTCSDALRVGTPVLTVPGETFASRVAAGILGTAGMDDWIVHSQEAYVKKAVAFGLQSREAIDAAKAQVKETYWSSPMVDNVSFARQFEALLLQLHEHHEQGGAVTSFGLTEDLKLERLPFGRNDGDEVPNAEVTKLNLSRPSSSGAEMPTPASGPTNARSWTDGIARGGQQARLVNLGIFKNEVLQLVERPLVVGVGAADCNGQIGYEPMAKAGLLQMLGFESNPASLGKLSNQANQGFLPTALGDGQEHTLHLCMSPGMNSILPARTQWLSLFPMFSMWASIERTISVQTSRLDDLPEAQGARFLKMDVQGAEKMILEHGQSVLEGLSLLQIKASPTPLYEGEASLWEIGEWLTRRGFVLHSFSDLNKRRLKPHGRDDSPFAPSNQLFQVDAVFMPDPLKWAELDDDRLLSLAFFAHAVYRSYDVAMLAIRKLDERDDNGRVGRYSQYLEAAGLDA